MKAIEDYDSATLRFCVRTEVFDAGRHPEDGEPMEGLAYYVMAEAPSGIRWYRHVGVVDVRVEDDLEWGYRTRDVGVVEGSDEEYTRAQVEKFACLIATRLEGSLCPRLNPSVWAYAGACYGSADYVRMGIEEETAALEREAERWG